MVDILIGIGIGVVITLVVGFILAGIFFTKLGSWRK